MRVDYLLDSWAETVDDYFKVISKIEEFNVFTGIYKKTLLENNSVIYHPGVMIFYDSRSNGAGFSFKVKHPEFTLIDDYGEIDLSELLEYPSFTTANLVFIPNTPIPVNSISAVYESLRSDFISEQSSVVDTALPLFLDLIQLSDVLKKI